MDRFKWVFMMLLSIAVLALVGCERTNYPQLQLGELEPAVQIRGSEEDANLKVALASITSPKESIIYYEELLQYLEEKLDKPIKVIQRKTYKEVNDLIIAGEVDLAFICTYSYVQGREQFGLEPFLVPSVNGNTTYQSYIIVPAGSPAEAFTDLKGKRFAFSDPDSTTGYLYPNWLVNKLGETTETFFRSTIFTYSHDNSIKAVADRVVDGAAIDGLVLDYIAEKQPVYASLVKVIDKSTEFGSPPVVASPHLSQEERQKIWEILTSMHLDPDGMAILEKIRVEKFVPQNDQAYDSIKSLAEEVGDNQP